MTPLEDLFSLPLPPGPRSPSTTSWPNSMRLSRGATLTPIPPTPRLAEAFEVKVPAAPLPQLLVVAHPKDHPLPPIYAKVTAEWPGGSLAVRAG